MAQSGFTPIQLYRTATASAAPSAGNLADGELAINTNDGRLFYKDSGGVVRTLASSASTSGVFAPGTVSAPGITFTGDTNTGIYSPAADTIAFSEGGVEAMRIDASGNVGVGTSSPTSRLTVAGGASPVEIYQNSASVRFSSSPNRTNNYYLGANISDSVDAGFIIGYGTDIGTGTPRIIINSSGNVGVGGSAGADSRLRIEGTESRLRSVNTTSGAIAYFGAMSPNEARAWSVTGTDLTLGTSNTERMRITASGLVGIGVSAPGSNLDVATSGAVTAGNVIRIFNSTDGASAGVLGLVKFGSTATTYGPYAANNVGVNSAFTNLLVGTETAHNAIFYTSNTERMRITPGGDAGIGTSSPRARLNVVGATGAPSLVSDANNVALTTSAISVELAEGAYATSPFSYWMQTKQTVNTGAFFPLVLNPIAGNVGIGTSRPTSLLHVDGAAITATVGPDYNGGVAYNNGNQRLEVNAWNGTPMVYMGRHNTNSFEISVASNGDAVFGQASLERMRIVAATGNVGIGTAAPAGRLDVVTGTNRVYFDDAGGAFARLNGVNAANSVYNPIAINGSQVLLTTSTVERFRVGPAGQLGVGGTNYGTSGQVLTSNGAGAAPSWQNAGGTANGLLLNVQVFTSSGTYTRTAGATRAVVIAVGGGGGGGGIGGAGGNGGTTSFGSHVSAGGGSGGGIAPGAGGAGGTGGTGATIAIPGQGGGAGIGGGPGRDVGVSGAGGGQGGGAGVRVGSAGIAGSRGGGGSGASRDFFFPGCCPVNGTGGGGGGQGETGIDYISSGLGATETVTIGAGGAAGASGGLAAGGAGGAGYIIVYEYS